MPITLTTDETTDLDLAFLLQQFLPVPLTDVGALSDDAFDLSTLPLGSYNVSVDYTNQFNGESSVLLRIETFLGFPIYEGGGTWTDSPSDGASEFEQLIEGLFSGYSLSVDGTIALGLGGAGIEISNAVVNDVDFDFLPPAIRMTIEAEDFSGLGASAFVTETNDVASGDALIRLPFDGPGTTGTVSHEFGQMVPGVYDLTVWYFDENDGETPVTLRIIDGDGNTIFVENWVFDEDLGSSSISEGNLTSRSIENVQIPLGARVEIEGTAAGSASTAEYVRLDRLDMDLVTPDDPGSISGSGLGGTGTTLFPDPTGGDALFDVFGLPDGTYQLAITFVDDFGGPGAIQFTFLTGTGIPLFQEEIAWNLTTGDPLTDVESFIASLFEGLQLQVLTTFDVAGETDGSITVSGVNVSDFDFALLTAPVVVEIEAEQFTGLAESNFVIEESGEASNDALIRLPFDGPGTTGTVTHDLSGLAPAVYDFSLFYFDENDGASPVTISILNSDGEVIFTRSITFDEDLGSSSIGDNRTEVTFNDVEIPAGSTLVIDGARSGNDFTGEYVRLDKVTFIQGAPLDPNVPDAVEDVATIGEDDGPTTIDVLANDTDLNDAIPGDVTIPSVGTVGTLGEVSVAANGQSVIYTPGEAAQSLIDGETLTDSFTYVLSDAPGNGNGQDVATVTVTVTGANDAPTAEDGVVDVAEDGPPAGGLFGGDDVDANDDQTTLIYEVTEAPAGGILTNNGDGTFTFDPNGEFEDLAPGEVETLTFTYTATDSSGLTSDPATVTLNVLGQDETTATPFVVEAEDFSGLEASPYVLEDNDAASNGALIRLPFDGPGTTGTVTHELGDAAGTFDIDFHFFDESDGESEVLFEIKAADGTVLFSQTVMFDGATSNSGAGADNLVNATFEGVTIPAGATVEITGTVDGTAETAEYIRLDRLEFTPTEGLNLGTIGPVSDADAAGNQVFAEARAGDEVGVTALATDPDQSDSVSYAIDDARFDIDPSTGVITVAADVLLTETSIPVEVTATSTDGSVSTETFTLTVVPRPAIEDVDTSANQIAEDAGAGALTGIELVTQGLVGAVEFVVVEIDNDSERFTVDALGRVVVDTGATFDATAENAIDLLVIARDVDGNEVREIFTLFIAEEQVPVGPVTDLDPTPDAVDENATAGTQTGITAFAEDVNTLEDVESYELDDERFAIDQDTGVITVADGAVIDAETEQTIELTVTATSRDGSTSSETFTIAVNDVDEFDVGPVTDTDGAANRLAVAAVDGDGVGITAFADDPDVTDGVTYELVNDLSGAIEIDADTGVITATGAINLIGLAGRSETVSVRAISDDGSVSTTTFELGISEPISVLTDSDGAPNGQVDENAAADTVVGITASATDADPFDTVTYSLTDDAGGRFKIDADTGVVTVADGSLLNAEDALSHLITAVATSTDGSFSQAIFRVDIGDVDEFDLTIEEIDPATNQVVATAPAGSGTGVRVRVEDLDATAQVTGLLVDANFQFGTLTFTDNGFEADIIVLDPTGLDAAVDEVVTVSGEDELTGDTATADFTIDILLPNQAPVLGIVGNADLNSLDLQLNEAQAGLQIADFEATDTEGDTENGGGLTYSLSGPDTDDFTFDVNTGVLSFAASPDFENPTDDGGDNIYNVTVTVSDSAGLTDIATVALEVVDVNEDPRITTSANRGISENVTTAIDIDATDPDGDTEGSGLTYAITGGVDAALFDIDTNTGEIAFLAEQDFENPGDADTDGAYEVQVTVTDSGSLTDVQDLTINLLDQPPVSFVTNAQSISENTTEVVDFTGRDEAIDGDAGLTYTLNGGEDEALFTVDADTGVLSFINAPDFENPLDANGDNEYLVNVRTANANGTGSITPLQVTVLDENEAPDLVPAPVFNTWVPGVNVSSDDPVTPTFVTLFIDVDATDDQSAEGLGGGLIYSVAGGADGARFTPVDPTTGVFSITLNLPDPTNNPLNLPLDIGSIDADLNGRYEVDIAVTDTNGTGLTDVESYTVDATTLMDLI